MQGNPVAGGLAYSPAEYRDRVNPADVAEWVNTDSLATHTATEDHGLWEVEVGPGEAARRVLVAGTHQYHCRIHPEMRGLLAVTPFAYVRVKPVQVVKRVRVEGRKRRRKVRRTVYRRSVVALWGAGTPEHLYDVERRRAGGKWAPWRPGTASSDGAFRARPGEEWEIRARVRAEADPARATEWSPPAAVVVD